MQRLLAAAGWDTGSIRHKQLEDALAGAGLEIVEKCSQPFAWVIGRDNNANDKGFIDAMAWSEGEFTTPVYLAPQPTGVAQAVVMPENPPDMILTWLSDLRGHHTQSEHANAGRRWYALMRAEIAALASSVPSTNSGGAA